MATRTAPDVTGASTSTLTTLRLIDASGDQTSVSIKTATPPTPALIEAWAVAYQGATQASLWSVEVSTAWEGVADSDNADVGQRNSIKDGVNMLYKDVANLKSITPRLIAPIPATMQGNQDIPLVSGTEFTALLNAQDAILTTYELYSVQYTERRERSNNPRVKI